MTSLEMNVTASSLSSSAVSLSAFEPDRKGGFLFAHQEAGLDSDSPGCGLTNLTIERKNPDGTAEPIAILSTIVPRTQYGDGFAYFITAKGELARHNLLHTVTEALFVPGIVAQPQRSGNCFFEDASHTVSDLLLSDDTLFYLQGTCGTPSSSGEESCNLYAWDLQAKKTRLIADVKDLGIPRAGLAFAMKAPQENTVYLQSAYGDAGAGAGILYTVDVRNGASSVFAKAELQQCDDSCKPAIAKENARYDEFFPSVQSRTCGAWTIKNDPYSLEIDGEGPDETLDQAMYIACLE